LFDQREAAIADLIQISRGFDLKEFGSQAVKHMLAVRKLTINLVNAARKWQQIVKGKKVLKV